MVGDLDADRHVAELRSGHGGDRQHRLVPVCMPVEYATPVEVRDHPGGGRQVKVDRVRHGADDGDASHTSKVRDEALFVAFERSSVG